MLSLNIETSRNLTSVSLSDDYQIKNILNVNSERPNHCELLSPLIKDLFKSIPFSLNDIQQVRVNVGPGNLSSLRVGIATANSISSFSRIPVYGISSFLLYAYSYQSEFKNLVTLFDLRNNLFAYARFVKKEEDLVLVEQNFKLRHDDLMHVDMNNSTLIGTGSDKVQIAHFDKHFELNIDSGFSIDSASLAKVNLKFNSDHVFEDMPLMPFNTFSFVS